jgi:maltose-binding protein MalE
MSFENTKPGSHDPSFGRLNGIFASLLNQLQDTEMTPTKQTRDAVTQADKELKDLIAKWKTMK